MIDLGTQPGVPTLPAVTLSLDEMDYLVDTLALDVLPVVLDAIPRYDTYDARDAAFRGAVDTLAARDLLPGGGVHPELADRLRVLARPLWEIALRWYVDGSISRLCISRGDTLSVLALRAGDTYVVQDAGADIFAPVIGALGAADPMNVGVVNAPTVQLGEVFDQGGDGKSLAAALTALGVTAADATVLGNGMAACTTYAEIVGIVYGDGRYDPVGGPVTVFDTSAGRIVGTSSVSAHGVAWSSLSPGTPQRLRQALESLTDRLRRPTPVAASTMRRSRGAPSWW